MPNKCFRIGDLVHCRYGFGYIIGLQHVRQYHGMRRMLSNYTHEDQHKSATLTWHMIGIVDRELDGTITSGLKYLVYDTAPTLFEPATQASISKIQSDILPFMNGKRYNSFMPGDIVYHHDYHYGIIISGGHIRPERMSNLLYYHVYYFSTETFDYDCDAAETKSSINNMQLWYPATACTKHIANAILQECYLMPIFTATADMPVSEFVIPTNIDMDILTDISENTCQTDRYGRQLPF